MDYRLFQNIMGREGQSVVNEIKNESKIKLIVRFFNPKKVLNSTF